MGPRCDGVSFWFVCLLGFPAFPAPPVPRVYRGRRTGYRLVVYIKVYKFQAGLAGIFPRWDAVGGGR